MIDSNAWHKGLELRSFEVPNSNFEVPKFSFEVLKILELRMTQLSLYFQAFEVPKKVPRKKFEHSKFLRGYSHLPEIKNWNFETSKFQLFWNFVLSKFQIQTSKFQSHSFEVPKILADPFEVPASKFQPLMSGIGGETCGAAFSW